MIDHEPRQDRVEAVAWERQLLSIALPKLDLRIAGPGQADHPSGGIEPNHIRPSRRRRRRAPSRSARDIKNPCASDDTSRVEQRVDKPCSHRARQALIARGLPRPTFSLERLEPA